MNKIKDKLALMAPSVVFAEGEPLADVLGRLYGEGGSSCGIAIIEGADLRRLEWKAGARVRKL